MQIRFEIQALPSNSKGWGRIKASSHGKAIIESRTGNEWVSASKDSVDLEPGQELAATIQEQLNVGKGRTARKEMDSYDFRLIADNCASVKIAGCKTEVLIIGARKA